MLAQPSPLAETANVPAVPALASAVYEGRVRHRRHYPHAHGFGYRVAYAFLDLDEIDAVLALHPQFRRERGGLAVFRRSDYLGDAQRPLIDCVRDEATKALGPRPAGPVRLLTHLRTFGHCFNPVSFYYGYQPDGSTLDWIVAEITNTPWKERHRYVLDARDAQAAGSASQWEFPKAFHVSPFLPMRRDYRWRFTAPTEHLAVHMEVLEGERAQFDATLNLQRREVSRSALSRLLWRYPLMTIKVVAAIHWQALITWFKRNPFYSHPVRYPDAQP